MGLRRFSTWVSKGVKVIFPEWLAPEYWDVVKNATTVHETDFIILTLICGILDFWDYIIA